MATTNFPNGLTSFGFPVTGSIRDIGAPFKDGNYWFVDQTFGVDDSDGTSTDAPFKTITFALAHAKAGDTLIIGPGSYDEGITVTTDYITMVGWTPGGYGRPDVLSPSGGGFTLNVHAQGFTAKHIRFAGSGVGGIGVQQMGNGFLYEDCVFESSSNIGFRFFPDMDDDSFTASEGQVVNCLIRNCGGGGMSFENPGPGIQGGVGPTDNVVANCRFYANTAADIFDVDTAGSNDSTFATSVITGCQFLEKNPSVYIDLSNGGINTGLISDNFFAFTTVGGLTNSEIVLGNDIAFSGNCDAVGMVDGHTF